MMVRNLMIRIDSWQSVKECLRSISIQNGGSDVRLRRRRSFRIALCTVNPLGACSVFTPSKLNVQVQLNPKP